MHTVSVDAAKSSFFFQAMKNWGREDTYINRQDKAGYLLYETKSQL